MPEDDSLEQAIRDNAQGPAQASGDAGSVQQHPLSEQIAADRYLLSKKASRKKGAGLKISKIVPPGTE